MTWSAERRRRSSALLAAAVAAVALLSGCATADTSGSPASRPAAPVVPTSAPAPAAAPGVPAAPSTTVPPSTPPPPPQPVNHCAANTHDQLVLVRISVQHMWLCHRNITVESNPITTGMLGQYTETPTGHYRIQGLNRNTVLTLNTGAQYNVKYWIPFNAPLFGFHDSSWQHFPYGSPQYKTAGSHGCVHMPLAAIAYLYRWARIGAYVSIS